MKLQQSAALWAELLQLNEDAIIIETGSDRVKMKFKKWCISTVDTVKEAPAKEKSSEKEEKAEKKGLFGKKKKDEEDK